MVNLKVFWLSYITIKITWCLCLFHHLALQEVHETGSVSILRSYTSWVQSKETGPVSEMFNMSWDETVGGTRFAVFTNYEHSDQIKFWK